MTDHYQHVRRAQRMSLLGPVADARVWTEVLVGTHKIVPVDAIVIDRAALPEVHDVRDRGVVSAGRVCRVDADVARQDTLREYALGYLALAEYLDAHPPVDEAQVKAITDALHRATEDPDDINVPDVARRLYVAGVRVPEVQA